MSASNQALTMNLRKFTFGIAREPGSSITNDHGGNVNSTGPGSCPVTFRPPPGITGRAAFGFEVCDSDTPHGTQTHAIPVN